MADDNKQQMQAEIKRLRDARRKFFGGSRAELDDIFGVDPAAAPDKTAMVISGSTNIDDIRGFDPQIHYNGKRVITDDVINAYKQSMAMYAAAVGEVSGADMTGIVDRMQSLKDGAVQSSSSLQSKVRHVNQIIRLIQNSDYIRKRFDAEGMKAAIRGDAEFEFRGVTFALEHAREILGYK